ncbi:nuclear transport factor 2 family protein [Nonomuraea rubra]|uniref:nuclear transport factor 2 family protein n=1 Tax=Nonomuraea rubra TaxID=46180 RepID=UPI00340B25CD
MTATSTSTATALGGPSHMVGRDAITRFLAVDFHRLFVADVSLDFRGFYADGDVVVVEETMTATAAGGGTYRNDYCFVFELRGGRIHRVREYLDTAAGHRMLGGSAPAQPVTRERSGPPPRPAAPA